MGLRIADERMQRAGRTISRPASYGIFAWFIEFNRFSCFSFDLVIEFNRFSCVLVAKFNIGLTTFNTNIRMTVKACGPPSWSNRYAKIMFTNEWRQDQPVAIRNVYVTTVKYLLSKAINVFHLERETGLESRTRMSLNFSRLLKSHTPQKDANATRRRRLKFRLNSALNRDSSNWSSLAWQSEIEYFLWYSVHREAQKTSL